MFEISYPETNIFNVFTWITLVCSVSKHRETVVILTFEKYEKSKCFRYSNLIRAFIDCMFCLRTEKEGSETFFD